MATEIDYDVDLSPGDTSAVPKGYSFSFQSANTDGSLSDLKLGLTSYHATDTNGTTVVTLLSDNNGSPGVPIVQLASVQDSVLLSQTPSPYPLLNIPLSQNPALAPSTRYWINVQTGLGAIAGNNFGGAQTTGTDGQYYQNFGAITPSQTGVQPDTPFAYEAQIAQTICFTSGTKLYTERGNVDVEDLKIGDIAITASGQTRPIRWVGNRTVECRGSDTMPVRIAAGAFGENVPQRDLYLSPGHPVLVGADEGEGGFLVPIMCLINGTTIDRVKMDQVTYWHIELDEHDILLAEGLPAESYIDLGSRPWFGGADGALYDPDMALLGMPGRCRPVAVDGPIVEAERRRLDAEFAGSLAAACAWPGEIEAAVF